MPTNTADTGATPESDPEVIPLTPSTDPTPVSTKRTVKDSEPLAEKDWMDKVVERPYAEAVTPAHREFLLASGIPVPGLTDV